MLAKTPSVDRYTPVLGLLHMKKLILTLAAEGIGGMQGAGGVSLCVLLGGSNGVLRAVQGRVPYSGIAAAHISLC